MNWKRLIKGLVALVFAPPLLYLLAMVPGAIVPGQTTADSLADTASNSSAKVQIYLLTGLLHADIAIPVDAVVLEKFSFLKQAGIPLNNKDLRYLVFGWGSREFYTIAGTYADVTLAATVTAITGDDSVMHIVPSGGITENADAIPVKLSASGFTRMLSFLRRSFADDSNGKPSWMSDKTHGYGDVFYEGRGGFNILAPCNVWTGAALREAGLPLGIWTPTTYSLKWSLNILAGDYN